MVVKWLPKFLGRHPILSVAPAERQSQSMSDWTSLGHKPGPKPMIDSQRNELGVATPRLYIHPQDLRDGVNSSQGR